MRRGHRQLLLLTLVIGLAGCTDSKSPSQPEPKVRAPSELSAAAVSPTEIRLNWRDNSDNEEGFDVEESVGGRGNYRSIQRTGPNLTTLVLYSRAPQDTTNYYRLRAYAGSDYSAYSNEASLTYAYWQRTFGGSRGDYFRGVIPTAEGGFLAAGYTQSSGAGESDGWLVKTDAQGTQFWLRTFGGSSYDYFSSVIPTAGGGYLAAGYTLSSGAGNDDGWLVKTDAQGTQVWQRTFGESVYDCFDSVIPTADGGYLAAGGTSSSGAENDDGWLVKTNALGNLVWQRTFGGSDEDYWFSSVIATADGGFLAAGGTESSGAGYVDGWLVKFNTQGNLVWQRTFGGSGEEVFDSVIATADGGFLAAGSTSSFGSGDGDGWLVKFGE